MGSFHLQWSVSIKISPRKEQWWIEPWVGGEWGLPCRSDPTHQIKQLNLMLSSERNGSECTLHCTLLHTGPNSQGGRWTPVLQRSNNSRFTEKRTKIVNEARLSKPSAPFQRHYVLWSLMGFSHRECTTKHKCCRSLRRVSQRCKVGLLNSSCFYTSHMESGSAFAFYLSYFTLVG